MDHLIESRPPQPARYDLQFHTFGCKVNTYDTGLLQMRLQMRSQQRQLNGFQPHSGAPRVHVLNTCAVTAEASLDAVRLVRRLKAREPLSTVVVTGCGAQVDGELFDELKGVDLIVANSHKGFLESILDQYFKGTLESRVFRSNIFRKEDLEAGGGEERAHTRSFLKIQDGCNSFCTYCVIPFARGKSRSLSVDHLVGRVKELIQTHEDSETTGAQEVVLTGVHIGDYEDDRSGTKLTLEDLIEEILARTNVARLRLSSLEPVEISPRLLKLFRNPRLCPHFHMSIQSANSRVLKAMRRNYDAGAVESALHAIADAVPEAYVGMDVIAGFPGESEDEFFDTYQRLARLPWTRAHVFPYSERPGTKAQSLPDPVARSEKTLRAQRLRELSSQRFASMALKQIGAHKHALLLKSRKSTLETLTRDYWPLRLCDAGGRDLQLSDLATLGLRPGQETLVKVFDLDQSTEGRLDGRLRGYVLGSA